jgi:putative oxidoreductase
VNRFLGPYQERIYAVMRFVMGFLFAFHGFQKLFGSFGNAAAPLVSQVGLGGVIEFFGGVLIAAGLFASWAAFVASGTMAVAYFQFHQPGGLWPIVNHGELAVVYSWIFLYIAARGAGKWSIASMLKKPAWS